MVYKTQAKRKRDIKSKLMAAVCMLLVSSIMMVSTTYAWFTLSTAPEVTGINTAVGANGNLEMALMPKDGLTTGAAENFGITSQAGDSSNAANLKNVTWGNLVDVSQSEFYGLDKITLYPAALNVTEAGTLDAAMLQTPSYGADGRVDELLENTTTSTYNGTNFPQNGEYGVRAVGTASGMTDRQLAYRNARSTANTNMALAKSTSSTSLNTNGAALANIAISHAANEAATHTQTDVENLLKIVNDLLGTDGKTGVLQYIEEAYRGYIVAYGASQDGVDAGMDDTEFIAFSGVVNSAATLSAALNELQTYEITIPEQLQTPINALATTRGEVEEAYDLLIALQQGASNKIEWADLSPALYLLADTNNLQINGYKASEFKDHMSAIISEVASKGLTVTMAPNGGVYADVADHCGNFNASINIARVEYNNLVLENMPARMETGATGTPYLTLVGAAVENAGAPSGVGGQTMPISDFYGYIIDLAFRTNAAESNLLLQTEATDRIYSDNSSDAETMGHGSTMTFTSTTTDFTVEQLKSLMGAIRVVFFDPVENNKVLGTAKLDLTEGKYTVTGGNTITASLYLYQQTAATTSVTYEPIAEDETGTHILDSETNSYREITGEEVGTHKAVTTTTAAGETKLENDKAVIKALTQNVAAAVSALVYLDGENVGNDDVAATAATSMTGTMNLQFASSANLVPMEYTPLILEGSTTETTAPTEAEEQG